MTEPEATWSPAGRAAPRRRPGAAPLRVAAVGLAAVALALRLLLAAAVVAAPVVGRAPARHPDSLSTTLVEVQGDEALLSMQLQVLSVLEVVDGLDADGDGEITAAELDARRAEVFAYVLGHYLLRTGTDRDMEGGVPLMPEPLELVFEPPGPAAGYRKGTVTVTFVLRHEAPIRDLLVESTLFVDTSPAHIDLCTLHWLEEDARVTFSIDARQPRARFDPDGRGLFGAFVGLGWHHILDGWDHLAFVVALVLASAGFRALLGVVTAFTLAHSVSLAAAALGWVDGWLAVETLGRPVEAVIALSIAYVAADTMVAPDRRRARWLEAFLFGLVHGLGFAGFLSTSLVQERSQGLALVAFNVGVEAGQVAVVVVLVLLLRLLPRTRGEDPPFLAPRWLRRSGSAVVVALGLFWFFERI